MSMNEKDKQGRISIINRLLRFIKNIDLHQCDFIEVGYVEVKKQGMWDREKVDIYEQCSICGKQRFYRAWKDLLE